MPEIEDIAPVIRSVTHRNLVFIHGKGGVGKTSVSKALAARLAQSGASTLWVALEDPMSPAGELRKLGPSLWSLNCDFSIAFEEYAALKIGVAPLVRLFLQNKLIRYLAKAAPGIHELVLLGKLWHERTQYSHVVVDLPSTGYGLAMFQSTENFLRLFHGGPLHKDAEAMMKTFAEPLHTGHLIVSLAEEMPLQESLELGAYLKHLFPLNPPSYLANRVFPGTAKARGAEEKSQPLAASAKDYCDQRVLLESENLGLWKSEGIAYGTLNMIAAHTGEREIVDGIESQLLQKGYA